MELLLGPDGEYIREIIIDELAKGIDAGWRSSLDGLVGSTRSRLLRAFGVSNAALCYHGNGACFLRMLCVGNGDAHMHIALCSLECILASLGGQVPTRVSVASHSSAWNIDVVRTKAHLPPWLSLACVDAT